MKDTIVMLFHTKDAAESFIDRLKSHDFSGNDVMLVGPDDLPQFGRGEHAAAAGGGIMDRIASFFSADDEERRVAQRYTSLADYLESRGLSRSEADHYESEVRAGNCMVGVKAGDRYAEVQELARGDTTLGGRAYGTFNRTDLDYDRDVDLGARSDIDRDYDLGMRGRDRISDEQTLELHEEVLDVGTAEVQTGEAEIGKRVVQEQKTIQVPVEREELVIERHPVEGREVSGDIDMTRSAAERIEIPLSEERPVVEKRVVASEEVTAGKSEVEEAIPISETVAREELDISRRGDLDYTDEELRDMSDIERRRILEERRRRGRAA